MLILTDPSVNVAEYVSPYRFVYLASGDAWKRRPYLPMTHMDALWRMLNRPPSNFVKWVCILNDQTFVNVPR